MDKTALALSGGGFRATLFHLGVLRYLRDSGHLSSVVNVSGVSGGSITAAHLVQHWNDYLSEDEADFESAAGELIALAQRNVRGRILLGLPFRMVRNAITAIPRLLFHVLELLPLLGQSKTLVRIERCFARVNTSDSLDFYLRRFFGRKFLLSELSSGVDGVQAPALSISATDLTNGTECCFHVDRAEIGAPREARFFFREPSDGRHRAVQLAIDSDSMPLGTAVAYSASFPGLFPPRKLEDWQLSSSPQQRLDHLVTDGGVYDNLGLRSLDLVMGDCSKFDDLIVSDAGAPVRSDFGEKRNRLLFVWQLRRAVSILLGRVGELEKGSRRLADRRRRLAEKTRFVDISSTYRSSSGDPTRDVQALLSQVRTDLDHFSTIEVEELIRHGQRVAAQAFKDKSQRELWLPKRPRFELGRPGHDRNRHLLRRLRKAQSPKLSSLFVPADLRSWIMMALVLATANPLWTIAQPLWLRAKLSDPPKIVYRAKVSEASVGNVDCHELFDDAILRALCQQARNSATAARTGWAVLSQTTLDTQVKLHGYIQFPAALKSAGAARAAKTNLWFEETLPLSCRGTRRDKRMLLRRDRASPLEASLDICRHGESYSFSVYGNRSAENQATLQIALERWRLPLIGDLLPSIRRGFEKGAEEPRSDPWEKALREGRSPPEPDVTRPPGGLDPAEPPGHPDSGVPGQTTSEEIAALDLDLHQADTEVDLKSGFDAHLALSAEPESHDLLRPLPPAPSAVFFRLNTIYIVDCIRWTCELTLEARRQNGALLTSMPLTTRFEKKTDFDSPLFEEGFEQDELSRGVALWAVQRRGETVVATTEAQLISIQPGERKTILLSSPDDKLMIRAWLTAEEASERKSVLEAGSREQTRTISRF